MLDRRQFLKTLWLGMFSLVSSSNRRGNAKDNQTKKLNILLILVDDMGWSDIGCYGEEEHPIPSENRNAEEKNAANTLHAAIESMPATNKAYDGKPAKSGR